MIFTVKPATTISFKKQKSDCSFIDDLWSVTIWVLLPNGGAVPVVSSNIHGDLGDLKVHLHSDNLSLKDKDCNFRSDIAFSYFGLGRDDIIRALQQAGFVSTDGDNTFFQVKEVA